MTSLTPHFTLEEMKCKCGCKSRVNRGNARKVCALAEELRAEIGNTPLIVVSAHRCVTHNKRVGGAPKSWHLVSGALDLTSDTVDAHDLCQAAIRLRDRGVPIGGIGSYSRWVHIDIGSRRDWTGR